MMDWGLQSISVPHETRIGKCFSCLSWEMTPERGANIGMCISGRGETLRTDYHPDCWQEEEKS